MLIKNDVQTNRALSADQQHLGQINFHSHHWLDPMSSHTTTTSAAEERPSARLHRRLDAPAPRQGRAERPSPTSTLEEVAVDILDGGINGGPGGDTSGSDIGVILGIYILKSFPWNSRMEFWKIANKMKIKTWIFEYLDTAS